MSKLDNVLFLSLGIISILFLCLIYLSFNPDISNKMISSNLKFGDLYQMAKVIDFRFMMPKLIKIENTHELKDSDIILMGDSFFNVSAGYPIFGQQLEQLLDKKIHNYNIQGAGELWRKTNPIAYLKDNNFQKDGKTRLLILESVDRGVFMRYANTEKYGTSLSARIPVDNDTVPPKGSIDLIKLNGNVLHLEGWAADEASAAPISQIIININGKPVGEVQTGFLRPDIAQFFNNKKWNNSGWSFDGKVNITPGKYKINAIMKDVNGNISQTEDKYFKVSYNVLRNIPSIATNIDLLMKTKLKSLDYLISENPLSFALNETINTIKFKLTGKTPPLTPAYSLNPNILYYKEEVNFFEHPLTQLEIEKIAENLKHIANYLKENYQIDFIFMPMPTKFTIYHKLAGNMNTNDFFPKLFSELDKRNVEYINLYDDFIKSNDLLYFPSDTHWNKKGIELGVKNTGLFIKDYYQTPL